MAMSPARAHFLRHSAALNAAAIDDGSLQVNGSVYELMLAKLAEDRRKLKVIQSVEGKAKLKAELLPEYAPYVDGVLAADGNHQDDVLVTVMVWRLDTGQWKAALDIAEHALRHGLVMPDQYQRNLVTVVTEELADQALALLQKNEHPPVDLDSLLRAEALVQESDMPDQVRAKLKKAIGYAHREAEQLTEALENLNRALELDKSVGVKKDIERLEREINKLKTNPDGKLLEKSPTPAQGGTESIAIPLA